MRRLVQVVFAISLCAGCQGPYWGAGHRVPPPATGSYGSPDTYYPGARSAPATGLLVPGSTNDGWTNVQDDSPSVAANANSGTGSQPRISLPQRATASNVSATRRSGMPINEVREPAAFQTSGTLSRISGSAPQGDVVGSGIRPASTTSAEANQLRNVQANWQTRVSSSPSRGTAVER
jgi:hypothetical protein